MAKELGSAPKMHHQANYEVGYAKPPISGQFKKGQSGNAQGRPKGSKNKARVSLERLKDTLLEEAYREVEIQDKKGLVKLPVLQAALRSLSLKAAKGHTSAQKLLLSSVSAVEAERQKQRMRTFDIVSEYKRKQTLSLNEKKSSDSEGIPLLPHPNDIEINYGTGEVIFHGPVNVEDLHVWDRLWAHKAALELEINNLIDLREQDGSQDSNLDVEDEIELNFHVLQLTCLSIMRRWQLPGKRLVRDFALQNLLDQHIQEKTEPKIDDRLLPDEIDYEELVGKFSKHKKIVSLPPVFGKVGWT